MAAEDKCKDVVYSSRVRFARNITGLPFPDKLTGEEEIYSVLMRGAEKALSSVDTFHMYRMNGLDPLTHRRLWKSISYRRRWCPRATARS